MHPKYHDLMAPIEPFHNIHVWPTWTEEAIKRRMDVQWNLSLGTSPSLYFITVFIRL